MRRIVIGSSVVAALSFGLVAPASGQELGAVEIDPSEGPPGTEVAVSLLDLGVVEDQCATTSADLAEQLYANELPDASLPWHDPGPVFDGLISRGPLIGFDVPDAWDPGPGEPQAGISDEAWAFAWHAGRLSPSPVPTTYEQGAAKYLWLFMDVLGNDGAVGNSQMVESYLPATFVLTFADVATQAPVGEQSNFDPETGAGSIVVSDLEPGFYGLAATCVVPEVTDESLGAALAAGAAVLENDPSYEHNDRMADLQSPLFEEMVNTMLPELMVPSGGPWVELFCVTDADGECPEDAPEEPPGLNGPVGGEMGGLGTMPAQAVAGDPTLTG